MPLDQSFVEHVEELLSPFTENMRCKKMMGGVMIWEGDAAFALITSDNVLHFKADEKTIPDFEAAGSERFGRMPYWSLPADVIEDPKLLGAWARKAIAVGRRTAKKH